MTDLGLHSKEKNWERTPALMQRWLYGFLRKRLSRPLLLTPEAGCSKAHPEAQRFSKDDTSIHKEKGSDKSLPRGEGCQSQTDLQTCSFPAWCRMVRAQINPPQPWKAGSWGICLHHTVHLCCDNEEVTSKAFLTSSSPLTLIENVAVGFQGLWGIYSWDGGVTDGLCKKGHKRAGSSRT